MELTKDPAIQSQIDYWRQREAEETGSTLPGAPVGDEDLHSVDEWGNLVPIQPLPEPEGGAQPCRPTQKEDRDA